MTRELVALLHGIAQPALVMSPLAAYLRREGFEVLNIDYPSMKMPIDKLALIIHDELKNHKAFSDYESLHFVTHSMGGLIIRSYLTRHRPENLGRVVMLAPPNKGSEVADFLKDVWLYKKFYGPAGQELTTEARKAYADTPVDFELGVIAGTNNILNPVSDLMLEKPNDGLVSVESTKISGMRDHVAVNSAHAFIMNDRKPREYIVQFLKNGGFETTLHTSKI